MSNELVKAKNHDVSHWGFSEPQLNLLRDTICKGCTNEQMELFVYVCKRRRLDPFLKQIYPVLRKDSKLTKERGCDVQVMTLQTSIDALRLIADRTGNYMPGREPTFTYDKNGRLLSATAYVKKRASDGSWHEVSASAFYNEYVQGFADYSNGGAIKPTKFWNDMPHNQLAKCAESLVIRRAFPEDCSGVYSDDEMAQADNVEEVTISPEIKKIITKLQADEIAQLLASCPVEYQDKVLKSLKALPDPVNSLYDLPLDLYDRIKNAAMLNAKKEEPKVLEEIVNATDTQ